MLVLAVCAHNVVLCLPPRVQRRQGNLVLVVRESGFGSRESGRGKSANSLRQQLQLLLLVPTCAGFTGHKG
jgi:hypothetical protein